MTDTGHRHPERDTVGRTLTVACLQLNSRGDVQANRAGATRLVRQAAAAGARLVILPETWTFKGPPGRLPEVAEDADGPSNRLLAQLAADLGVYVLAGSLYERTSQAGRYFNTSVLYGPDGEALATYRKVHLFDAVAGATVYRESEVLEAGADVVTAQVDGLTVGLSICYDLRFPELYRMLAIRGARLLLVPAAFTAYTGRDHWEVLLRARAIENGCFVAAADQHGQYLPGHDSYGRSMIVDPWGTVIAQAADGVGLCVAELDLGAVDRVRAQLPALANRRADVYEL